MTIQNGVVADSNNGYLGSNPGSVGVANVDGAGSTWNTQDLHVGESGSGTLNITRGGTVYVFPFNCCFGSAPGSVGVVTVDGTGSMLRGAYDIHVGASGSGTLNITRGGAVNFFNSCYLGDASGSSGTVTVDGSGSTLLSSGGFLQVGGSGSGTLNITHGGTVSDGFGCVGGSAGNVTVDGAGSMWTVAEGPLYVGCSDQSQLDSGGPFYNSTIGKSLLAITNGGVVNSSGRGGCIATSLPGGVVRVTVDGTGSQWVTNDLQVGYYQGSTLVPGGTASLAITNGGLVAVDGTCYIDPYAPGSAATVTVDGVGSQLKLSSYSTLQVGYLSQGLATLNITRGGVVSDAYGEIGLYNSPGEVTVDGAGSKWINNGLLQISYFSGSAGARLAGADHHRWRRRQ